MHTHTQSLFKNSPGSFVHTRLQWEMTHMPIRREWINKLQCIQIILFGNNKERTSITTTQQPGMSVIMLSKRSQSQKTKYSLSPCMRHSGPFKMNLWCYSSEQRLPLLVGTDRGEAGGNFLRWWVCLYLDWDPGHLSNVIELGIYDLHISPFVSNTSRT